MEMEASDVTGSISETLVSEPDPHEQSTPDQNPLNESNSDVENHESRSSINGSEIFRALEVVERDAIAIGESFTSLFSSLRLALSEVTSTSVEHMRCFNDAAGRLQESALDAATKGNRFINSCLRLNEEMKGIDDLSLQFLLASGGISPLPMLDATNHKGVARLTWGWACSASFESCTCWCQWQCGHMSQGLDTVPVGRNPPPRLVRSLGKRVDVNLTTCCKTLVNLSRFFVFTPQLS